MKLPEFITARDLADKLFIKLVTVQARARRLNIGLRGGRYIFTEAEAKRIAACDPKPGPKAKGDNNGRDN